MNSFIKFSLYICCCFREPLNNQRPMNSQISFSQCNMIRGANRITLSRQNSLSCGGAGRNQSHGNIVYARRNSLNYQTHLMIPPQHGQIVLSQGVFLPKDDLLKQNNLNTDEKNVSFNCFKNQLIIWAGTKSP